MSLTREQVEKFQKIYKERFGEEISYDEALKSGTKLVNLMRIIYKPITKEDFEKYSQSMSKEI